MHVVHGVGWYFPDGEGGTERYVAGLCAGLARRGIQSTVIAPAAIASSYIQDGVAVVRYAVDPAPSRAEMRADVVPEGFLHALRASGADSYHQHSVTRGLGVACLSAARTLGLRTIHTMHTATPVCLRGTLLRPDGSACDGFVDIGRCARCWLDGRGRSQAWSFVPVAVGNAAITIAPRARIATALSTRGAVAMHRQRLRELLDGADRTVVGSRWQRDVLLRNGARSDTLRIVPPGLDAEFALPDGMRPEGPARILFVARLEPMKGLHVLLGALHRISASGNVELVVVAAPPPKGSPHVAYATEQLAAARVLGATVVEAGDRAEVARHMATCDIVAIPSQVLETGPLVALEAEAAGAWIVASDLGGLSERVTPDLGELVPAPSEEAWAFALSRAIATTPERRRLRTPRIVRSSDDVAADMARIYGEVA